VVTTKRLNVFERYLSLWVGLCMVVGILLGHTVPAFMNGLRSLEFGRAGEHNEPIALVRKLYRSASRPLGREIIGGWRPYVRQTDSDHGERRTRRR
jgi:hypothetical protein